MKITYFLTFCIAAMLVGCSSQPTEATTSQNASNPQEQIDKIQNDANMPDGLKQIKTDTLRRQPGVKR